MLKQDRPLFAALLAIAFAIFLCWAIPSPYSQPKHDAAKCTTHECRQEANEQALTDYTGTLALFTAALFGATLITAGFGAVQIWFLRRADVTARISADAAKKSADAALSTERARIFIKIVGNNIPSRIRNIVENRENGKSINSEHPLQISFRLINHGKTPAIVAEVRASIRVSQWPDSKPSSFGLYFPLFDSLPRVLPGGGGESESLDSARHTEVFTYEDAEKVFVRDDSGPGKSVWFFGMVSYADVFGGKWVHRFLWEYDGWSGQFHPEDYKHYNEST